MRRALIAALAGLALTAPPAGRAGRRSSGGGSFNNAPVLEARALHRHPARRRAALLRRPAQAGAEAERRRRPSRAARTRATSCRLPDLQPLCARTTSFDGQQTAHGQSRPAAPRCASKGQRVGRGRRRDLRPSCTPSRAPTTCRSPPGDAGSNVEGGAVRHLDRPPGDGRGHPEATATATAEPGGDRRAGGGDGGPRQQR